MGAPQRRRSLHYMPIDNRPQDAILPHIETQQRKS